MVIPTAHLTDGQVGAIRALLHVAFDGDFADTDWEHGLGGLHVVMTDPEGGDVVAHGSLVARRLLVGGTDGRSLRCGYVEGVAVHPDRQRRGLGHRVMAELEALAPGYDVLALSTSEAGEALYRARGWVPWRGPTAVLAPTGLQRTPDDDGGVFVLVATAAGLDLDAEIACDWRDGDVW